MDEKTNEAGIIERAVELPLFTFQSAIHTFTVRVQVTEHEIGGVKIKTSSRLQHGMILLLGRCCSWIGRRPESLARR